MSGALCPYCRTAIAPPDEEMQCEGCGTPHHKDCYEENTGCTVFGCRCAPAEEPKVAVSAPEVAAAVAARPVTAQYAPATLTMSTTMNGIPISQTPAQSSMPAAPVIQSAITNVPAAAGRNKMTFVMLGIFLGMFGIHNFYAGYSGKGLIQLCLTLLTIGYGAPMAWIWAIIEICIVTHDANGVQFRA